jgi:O-antigen/teichoic acid export membrane protein
MSGGEEFGAETIGSATQGIGRRVRGLARSLAPSATAAVTAAERSKDRYRRALLTTIAAVGARGLSVLIMLAMVPLVLDYLGSERFGLWIMIISLLMLLAFTDLGIASGLINAVAEAHGKDDIEATKRHVSSAFFMLAGVAIALGVLFGVSYPFVAWADALSATSPEARAEVGSAIAVLVGCFLVSMPLSVVERTQAGIQEGYVTGIWAGLGSLMSLGGILLAIELEAGLPWLVAVAAGAPVVAMALNGLRLFGWKRPWLRPRWSYVTRESSRHILRLGFLFFVLQLSVAMAFTSDNIVAGKVLGAEAVTQYAVPFRLFSIVPALLSLIYLPLWPAYGEAIARGDTGWARKTLVRSLLFGLALTISTSALLVAFGSRIIELWVGGKVVPSFALLLGLGVWSVVGTAGTAVAMFLNGANVIRFQVIVAVVMAPAALATKIALADMIGVPGIIWGTIIAYCVLAALPIALYVPRVMSRLTVEFKPPPAAALGSRWAD